MLPVPSIDLKKTFLGLNSFFCGTKPGKKYMKVVKTALNRRDKIPQIARLVVKSEPAVYHACIYGDVREILIYLVDYDKRDEYHVNQE